VGGSARKKRGIFQKKKITHQRTNAPTNYIRRSLKKEKIAQKKPLTKKIITLITAQNTY